MTATMTITGIDERTKLTDVVRLAEQYPWLEIGMLYTVTPEGRNRYPSWEWLTKAAEALSNRCALHVCGRAARDHLFGGGLTDVTKYTARIQVNGIVNVHDVLGLCSIYRSHTLITQDNTHNEKLRFCDMENHALLMDGSGGRGISPTEWSQPATWKDVGFAGGLGPDNLTAELPKIAAVARGDWWIDLESGLRDSNDWFDVQRCMEVLDIMRSWKASELKES